jgi:hypothetical protein
VSSFVEREFEFEIEIDVVATREQVRFGAALATA